MNSWLYVNRAALLDRGANQTPLEALALAQRTTFTTGWLDDRRLDRQEVSSTKDMVL